MRAAAEREGLVSEPACAASVRCRARPRALLSQRGDLQRDHERTSPTSERALCDAHLALVSESPRP